MDKKKLNEDEFALKAVKERVEFTRKKAFSSRTVAELIEFSHMGHPTEQFNIGVEIE